MKKSTRNRKQNQAATKRAAIYVRVSSEEQVEGYSLSAQERAARAYCEAHGWELVLTYADEGRSAWTDDIEARPEFARMLADAEANRFDVLIVHKLDRFARNVRPKPCTCSNGIAWRSSACLRAWISRHRSGA